MSSSTPTIDPDDLERGRADGSVESVSPQTFRINRRRLLNFSSEDVNSTDTSTDSIDLPKDPVSIEMCLYLGFSEDKARSLVSLWHRLADEGSYRGEDFGDFVVEWVNLRPWGSNVPDDWTHILRDTLGLDPELVTRMMDPAQDFVRLREPPEYWVVSLIKQRWYVYAQACAKLRQRGAPAHASGWSRPQPLTSSNVPDSKSSATQPDSTTQASGYDASGSSTSPGYTILYRGVYLEQAKRFFPNGSSTARPWTLQGNASQPGGDFNGESLYHYWTPQFMAAHAYARYKLHNNGYSQSVYVIQITVPNPWIETQRRLVLDWPSNLFKQVVWHSRRQLPLGEGNVPEAEGYQFFIGDAATGTVQRYLRMPSWTHMTESVLMMTRADPRVQDPHCRESERVRQYAFSAKLGRELVALRPQPDIKVLHFEQRYEVTLHKEND